jgi:lysophospholipase L1-like esterase
MRWTPTGWSVLFFWCCLSNNAFDMKERGQKTRNKRHSPRGLKSLIFRIIVLVPLLVLLVFAGSLAGRIAKIRQVKDTAILKEVSQVLGSRAQTPFSIEGAAGSATIKEDVKEGEKGARQIKVRPGHRTIFMFGGSTLYIPEGESLPEQLQHLVDKEGMALSVINFSYFGLTSSPLAKRVEASLAWHKPDLVVYYGGHNEYSSTYWNVVLPHYSIAEGAPLLRWLGDAGLSLYEQVRVFRGKSPSSRQAGWRFSLEPTLMGWMQRAGLVSPSLDLFQQLDGLVVKRFEDNLERIIRSTASAGVHLLLATPVSNLHSAPVGIGGDAEDLYAEGLQEKDHTKHVQLLRQARDRDRFSGFVRAKTPLIRELRTLGGRADHVSLIDLEQIFLDKKIHLDSSLFLDSIHLTPKMHKQLAREILNHIKRKGLLKRPATRTGG